MKRAQAAADKIKTESDNQKVYIEELDLGDFDSVRNFAKRFIQKSTRLDILINNAGRSMHIKITQNLVEK